MESIFETNDSSVDSSTPLSKLTTEDSFFQDIFFHPSLIEDNQPCKAILHYHVGNTNLRVWDLIIILPNIAFLIFLFYRLPQTRLKLRATSSELYKTIYFLLLTCSLVSTLRCLLSMIIHLDDVKNDMANKAIWVTSRFILLTAELSVAVFGSAFGVIESKQSIQIIILASGAVSFTLCAIQAYLEIFQPFYGLMVLKTSFHLYGHGGPIYWAVTSLLLCLIYMALLFTLPCPTPSLSTMLPHTNSFYLYCFLQFTLHSLTAAGAIALAINVHFGLCIANFGSFATFSLLSPLLFGCFLHNWFSSSEPNLLFAYKAQMDDHDEDATMPTSSSIQSFRQDEMEGAVTQASFVNEPIYNSRNRSK